MSAMEDLRVLLDERGVEWRHHGEKRRTWFDVNEIAWFAIETPAGYLIINSSPLTPEQAIAATLGSCNCSNDCTDSERTGERTETCEMEYVTDWMSWHCKSCDYMDMAPRNPKPRYCKWCGRKVETDG